MVGPGANREVKTKRGTVGPWYKGLVNTGRTTRWCGQHWDVEEHLQGVNKP